MILSVFDYSTIMVKPWIEAGYWAMCFDKKHPSGYTNDGKIGKIGCDVRRHNWHDFVAGHKHEAAIAFFFPPCTDVAVSGARWFKDKGLGKLIEALELFKLCIDVAEMLECPYMIENPVSTVSTYWRKPDYVFDPCDYGDPWTKKTHLWTGNGFIMPPKNRVEPTETGKIHRMPPSPDRAEKRSETPPRFARAVFEANNLKEVIKCPQ